MTEDTKVQDKPEEGKPQSEMHTESKPTEENTLPDSATERTTEQFDKLKESNKSLNEKLKQYEEQEVKESVLDSLKPKASSVVPTPTGSVPSKDEPGLVDTEGYVDAGVLQGRLTAAETKAKQAEQAAKLASQRFEKFEETAQIREAYEQFPALNPNSKSFDKKFFDLTKDKLIVQMVNGERDVVKAASSVTEIYKPVVAKKEATPDGKTDATEEDAKANINAGTDRSASTESSYSSLSESDLVEKTQKGDPLALKERLARAGF